MEMQYEKKNLDEITVSSIKQKFNYLNKYFKLYCRQPVNLKLSFNELKIPTYDDNYDIIYEGIIYISPNKTNILLIFVIALNEPFDCIKIYFNKNTPFIDFLINWVYFMTYNIVTNDGTIFTDYSIIENNIYSLDVDMVAHIKNMNKENYLRQYFIESCKKIKKHTPSNKITGTSMLTSKYRHRKNPHELTKQFKPKTILKLKSSSSLSSSDLTKKLYKKRYGIQLASNQNRFKTTKRISHINSDIRSKLRKYTELPKKYSSEVESSYDMNIGLLIITAHGGVEFTSKNIPIVDIPPEIKNTYYKSSSKPGCGSFRPKKIYSINNPHNLEQRRNNIEKCFRETNNKREFSKYFFECDAERHKLFMRHISESLDISKLESLQSTNMYKPDVYNGKVKKILNKSFATNSEEDIDEDNPHNQIILILYNTVDKIYIKLNLFNMDDITKLCIYIKENKIRNEEQLKKLDNIFYKIHNGLTKNFVGTNPIKQINIKDILILLSFLELDDLYIYDDSCSHFILPETVIEEIKQKGKTIDEIHREISKIIHKEAPIKQIGI